MKTNLLNRIVLRRVAMEARIGLYAWELESLQPIVLDVEFDLPRTDACQSDDLNDTIDYAAVIDTLKGVAVNQPHKLVEAMAETMCVTLHERFGLRHIRLTLLKLAPVPRAEVGIVVERVWTLDRTRVSPANSRIEEKA